MPNAWFRFYHEWDSDPKVQMMSEPMQRRLAMLFCWRCRNETFQETRAAFHWRITLEELAKTKAVFMENGFIDATWELINWNRRQFLSDSSTDRVRRHRKALKQDETLHETVVPVTVTAPDTDTDTDTEQKKPSAKDKPSQFALPLWISEQTWKDFEEMRKKIKAPLTDRARQGIVAELAKINAAGGDPEPVLLQSITRAWRGVFPLKTSIGGENGRPNQNQQSPARERVNGNRRALAEIAVQRGWIVPPGATQPDGEAIPESGFEGRPAGIHERPGAVEFEVLPPDR